MGLPLISPTEISSNDKVFNTTPIQDGFMFSEAKFPAFVASWGTGKSFTAIQRALILSEESPDNLGVIFRREFTDLRDSTLKDFELYTGLKVSSDRSVTLDNGSTILFRHLEEMHGTMQNMNLGWFWIEQAEELETETQFYVLHGRLRRNVKRRSGFITANTNGKNWIYKIWKANKGGDADYPLFEANSLDHTGYLPADTVADWQKLKARAPKMYARFVMNSWDESDTSDLIIQPEWIRAATLRSLNITPPIRKIVSVDVSRFGDDKTVCYAIENNRVIGRTEWEKKNTMETVGMAILFAGKFKIHAFAVDEIGVGGGVADRLSELEKEVVFVNASQRDAGKGYYNRRAEIHDFTAKLFQDGMVEIDEDDTDLIEQLSWAKYKTVKSNGVYQVEAKEDIKARYHKSPDHSDAYMNGLWALPQVKKYEKRDAYKERDTSNDYAGMSI